MQYENERIEYKSQMVHDMGVYVRQCASVCRHSLIKSAE